MLDRESETRRQLTKMAESQTPAARARHLEKCFALWEHLLRSTVRRLASQATQDEHEDLLGAARLGLLQAIDTYQTGFGTRFESFAIGKIRCAIWACAKEMQKPRQWCGDWSEFAELDNAQTSLVDRTDSDDPARICSCKERTAALARAVGSLETRDQVLIGLRYGANTTAVGTAKAMGISPTRVAQLEYRALARLRAALGEDGHQA